MEWVTAIEPDTQRERMEVEIGYVPRMEVSWNSTEATELRWDAQISREQASAALEKLLYPFKKVRLSSNSRASMGGSLPRGPISSTRVAFWCPYSSTVRAALEAALDTAAGMTYSNICKCF